MLQSDRYIDQAIEELRMLRERVKQFKDDKTVSPGCAEIIVAALNHAIDILIPF